jgi:RNA polymerase sigma-70 factor (ECF subfamily)
MTKGDFESIVREHQKMVYSIALNFFPNTAIAEEIAQDVFLQLYENRLAVKTGAHCVAWLRRSTLHRCIDASRRASFWRELQVEALPEIPADLPETDPLLQERLRQWIASLPETQRSVMVLRFGEDMDADEIGRTLQIPVRTVWTHLQRATARIREKAARYLKEDNDEPVRARSS